MEKIGILFYALTTALCINAQTITIIDYNTLQPINNVEVYLKRGEPSIGKSNDKGQIIVKNGSADSSITFMHPLYTTVTIKWTEIKNNEDILKMVENIYSIDEVVISASKFEEKRKDVAQKIQVMRASEIQNMNQSSMADVLANAGNIMVQKSQQGGGSPIIRGFETNKVLIVVDGIRMNNAIYRGGHLQNVITLDNAIMDRTEIVYGPGSVVYGSDAL
ncbi:MAG: Plug domain-containing protein, partial [Crocinitomicaceae bacterium]|nr:Plug domain-containing protein [Crocinitomicaceae bacterium]